MCLECFRAFIHIRTGARDNEMELYFAIGDIQIGNIQNKTKYAEMF